MSDIEYLVETLQEHGAGAATTVAGLYAARKLFGPTLDMVGVRLKEIAEKRIEIFGKISAKADKLASKSDAYPHVRTAQRILNDATLYDDDLQQTYVAGLLAGSRNSDGSDDRPVFYLSIIDGLTASQLQLFHAMFAGIAQAYSGTVSVNGPISTRIALDLSELNSYLAQLGEGEQAHDGSGIVDLFALEHVGLVGDIGMLEGPEGKGQVLCSGTRIGAMLYDWAYGFSDDDIREFGVRQRPDIGLPEIVYSKLQVL